MLKNGPYTGPQRGNAALFKHEINKISKILGVKVLSDTSMRANTTKQERRLYHICIYIKQDVKKIVIINGS